ncbi:hypothetical protein GCM10017607_26230 [Microbacterium thalassium]|nr:hypothetical protein GCM10017607_26230 [Microbacterium thalassium]
MTEPHNATTAELLTRISAQTRIDDPTAGWSDPETFQAESLVWPERGWERIERTGTIESPERDVWEYVYHRPGSAPAEVPVAFVWDKTAPEPQGRVYYNKAHLGLTEPRRPLVAPTPFQWPEELRRYYEAITSGERALLEAAIDERAVFQSPVGPVPAGVFIDAFASTPERKGGVPLQFNTVTAAGHDYAVEFTSWRRPPHGGLGVYGFRQGKLVSARAYEGPVYR